jgi:hypothetical protein
MPLHAHTTTDLIILLLNTFGINRRHSHTESGGYLYLIIFLET